MRPNQSGHGAMGAYLLFVMVAFVIIYLFYAVIHPERF
ncbi:MAG: potassium-transporting ATPase subunit F [Xanthobacteraceae bacterium]